MDFSRLSERKPAGSGLVPGDSFFMKLREIDLYTVIHRSFDVNNLDDPW